MASAADAVDGADGVDVVITAAAREITDLRADPDRIFEVETAEQAAAGKLAVNRGAEGSRSGRGQDRDEDGASDSETCGAERPDHTGRRHGDRGR